MWAFYEQEQKHQWRGQLAWDLFELQQQGDSAALQKVILGRGEGERAARRTDANQSTCMPSACPFLCTAHARLPFFCCCLRLLSLGVVHHCLGLLCLQLLVAMARTHVSTLQKLLPRLWLLVNPLLLTSG